MEMTSHSSLQMSLYLDKSFNLYDKDVLKIATLKCWPEAVSYGDILPTMHNSIFPYQPSQLPINKRAVIKCSLSMAPALWNLYHLV